jgi:hypothetical protein
MSKLDTIYNANPLASLPLDSLLYVLDNPATTDDDAGINANDLIAQIIGTRINGYRLTWNSGTSIGVGVGLLACENRDVIKNDSVITKGSLSLSNSTWYHVYVYLSAGVPAAEVATTAPAAWRETAYSKTGDTSRRYVGSIRTSPAGAVLKFIHSPTNNFIKYNDLINNGTPYRILSAGAATSTTAVSIANVTPITTTFVEFMFISVSLTAVLSNAAGQDIVLVLTTQRAQVLNFHESQNIYYRVASGGSANIDVSGYQFDR